MCSLPITPLARRRVLGTRHRAGGGQSEPLRVRPTVAEDGRYTRGLLIRGGDRRLACERRLIGGPMSFRRLRRFTWHGMETRACSVARLRCRSLQGLLCRAGGIPCRCRLRAERELL